MQVQEIAEILAISTDTVRYYLREGLVCPRKNPDNGYRIFLKKDLDRFRFVLAARKLGFSISDIKEILAMSDKGEVPCPEVKKLIETRLEETERQFQEVVRLRKIMRKAIDGWQDQPEAYTDGDSIFNLIESFQHN